MNGCWRWGGLAAALFLGAGSWGCATKSTRLDITNYRAAGEREYFHQSFSECFYSLGTDGNLNLVLRRITPVVNGTGEAVTQVVHVRTIYRAEPGETHVESSMINGLVSYAVLAGGAGTCFEGGGFITFSEDRRRSVLTGSLESAKLHKNRSVGTPTAIFDRAELTGRFIAHRDRPRVVAILNELDRVFGPQPQYVPPAGVP